MGCSKKFLFLGLLAAFVLLIASKASARDLTETSSTSAQKTNNGLEDAKYGNYPGGGGGYPGGGGHPGGGGGGNPGGGYGGGYPGRGGYGGGGGGGGGYCRHGCCYRGNNSCRRCCSYAGEVAEAQVETKPHN